MPDILIRMEMPKHCFNCSTKIDPDNRRCNIDGHVFEETLGKLTCGRDRDCPLHELPEHGDLIDKSELLENSKVNGMYPHWIDTMEVKRAPVIVPSNKEDDE